MPVQQHWFLKVMRLMGKGEVKTPLSFLYRLLPTLVIAIAVTLYAPIGDDFKRSVVGWFFFGLLGMAAAVLLFAWFKPKNIVYGETGHRAERRMEFGTGTGAQTVTLNRAELDQLPLTSDPNQPKLERD